MATNCDFRYAPKAAPTATNCDFRYAPRSGLNSEIAGDFGDAQVIRKFGEVPDDLSAL